MNWWVCIVILLNFSVHAAIVILDPAGDATRPGRTIGNAFERSITLQIAEQLKATIEEQYAATRVFITRKPGDRVLPLQHAQFANRMHADLYISIACYQTDHVKPCWYLYYYSDGNDMIIRQPDLAFFPYDQAHRIHKEQTLQWAQIFKTSLQQHEQLFLLHGPYGIPLEPLLGIVCPAFLLELELKYEDDYKQYIALFAQSIAALVQ